MGNNFPLLFFIFLQNLFEEVFYLLGGKNAIPPYGRKHIFARMRSNPISKTLPYFGKCVFEKRLRSDLFSS